MSHTPISPATKTIKANVFSATNSNGLLKRLKMAPTTLPTVAGNASTAFPASFLSPSASLSNHFFKASLSFDGGPPTPLPSSKSPIVESIIVVIPVKKEVSVKIISIICSRIKIQILCDHYFITILFKSLFDPCDLRLKVFSSISSLACFSLFKSPNISLYNCLCSSE